VEQKTDGAKFKGFRLRIGDMQIIQDMRKISNNGLAVLSFFNPWPAHGCFHF